MISEKERDILFDKLDQVLKRFDALNDKIEGHIEDDKKIHESIAELVAVLKVFKSGAKVFVAFGTAGRILAYIVAGGAALFGIYTYLRTGVPPSIHLD